MSCLRAKANPGLQASDYESVLKQWLCRSHPMRPLDQAFGPWVTNYRKMTRDALMRVVPLAELMLGASAEEMVMLSHRFECAITSILSKTPDLRGQLGNFAANEATNHVQLALSVLRDLRREEGKADVHSSAARAFPKTGRSRKALTTGDWAIVRNLFEKMKQPVSDEAVFLQTSARDKDVTPQRAIVDARVAIQGDEVVTPQKANVVTRMANQCDEVVTPHKAPSCFAKYLASQLSRSASGSDISIASTVPYEDEEDEDDEGDEEEGAKTHANMLRATVPASGRKRRLQAIANRVNAPGKSKPKTVMTHLHRVREPKF